jgi:hypothetical protein
MPISILNPIIYMNTMMAMPWIWPVVSYHLAMTAIEHSAKIMASQAKPSQTA